VSEIHLRTLADLGDKHAIYAICAPCRRSERLDVAKLAGVYGAQLTIAELKHRLTCSHCRARPRCIRIVYAVSAR
jgi:hypothetical protein